eukprot:CAMPEP_0118867282 /NCGR_PEP_ID=MMETSP1163-20130328/10937_1 /TAXON_ID=124430 /ORGANISM="Phaeomonas parva, Strain CCMP2877" /LENGTH=178 /DNA_ID=CAMNT_0006801683 /DNA_START=283 /DNA_END=822 /DNA_ORIENTATION=+
MEGLDLVRLIGALGADPAAAAALFPADGEGDGEGGGGGKGGKGKGAAFLRAVNFLLHDDRGLLEDALALLERGRVRELTAARSRRVVHVVVPPAAAVPAAMSSAAARAEHCFEGYCSCAEFLAGARESFRPLLCRHLLAVKCGHALGKIEREEVPDASFSGYLADLAGMRAHDAHDGV